MDREEVDSREDSNSSLVQQLLQHQLERQLAELLQQQPTMPTVPYAPQPVSTASQAPASVASQQNPLASLLPTMLSLGIMGPAMIAMLGAAHQQRQEEAPDDRDRADEPPPDDKAQPPPPDDKAQPPPPDGKAQPPGASPPPGAQPPPPANVVTANLGGTPVTAAPDANTALQKAFDGPNPDARLAYSGTRGAETHGPWQPVGPEKVQNGDIAMWERHAALLVTAPDGLKIVSNGQLLPAEPHNGEHGAFLGFRHPSGLDPPVQVAAAPPPRQTAAV